MNLFDFLKSHIGCHVTLYASSDVQGILRGFDQDWVYLEGEDAHAAWLIDDIVGYIATTAPVEIESPEVR